MECPECDIRMNVADTKYGEYEVYRVRYCVHCDAHYVTCESLTDHKIIPATSVKRTRRQRKKPSVAAHNPFGL